MRVEQPKSWRRFFFVFMLLRYSFGMGLFIPEWRHYRPDWFHAQDTVYWKSLLLILLSVGSTHSANAGVKLSLGPKMVFLHGIGDLGIASTSYGASTEVGYGTSSEPAAAGTRRLNYSLSLTGDRYGLSHSGVSSSLYLVGLKFALGGPLGVAFTLNRSFHDFSDTAGLKTRTSPGLQIFVEIIGGGRWKGMLTMSHRDASLGTPANPDLTVRSRIIELGLSIHYGS